MCTVPTDESACAGGTCLLNGLVDAPKPGFKIVQSRHTGLKAPERDQDSIREGHVRDAILPDEFLNVVLTVPDEFSNLADRMKG